MLRFTRRNTLSVLAALALAACGGTNDGPADTGDTDGGDATAVVLQDIIFGDPNAPVTLIEYASWTCPACLQFHTDVVPMLKSDYIETGKVKLIFRKYSEALIGGEVCGGDEVGEMVNLLAALIQAEMTADEIATFQMGTHPLLTASPVAYQLVNAAEPEQYLEYDCVVQFELLH